MVLDVNSNTFTIEIPMDEFNPYDFDNFIFFKINQGHLALIFGILHFYHK